MEIVEFMGRSDVNTNDTNTIWTCDNWVLSRYYNMRGYILCLRYSSNDSEVLMSVDDFIGCDKFEKTGETIKLMFDKMNELLDK